MSHPRVSASICCLSALNAFLLAFLIAPPCATPTHKVAQPLPPTRTPMARTENGRVRPAQRCFGGNTPCPAVRPRRCLQALASAMPRAAKSPCTNSARHDDDGKQLPHNAQAAPRRLTQRRSVYRVAARAHAPERAGAVGHGPGGMRSIAISTPLSSGAVLNCCRLSQTPGTTCAANTPCPAVQS